MRVALLTPEMVPTYGWARYGVDLAQALSHEGVEVVALTQRTTPPPAGFGSLADVRPILPHLYPPTRGFVLRLLLAAPRVMRAVHDCDVLHVVAEPYTLVAGLAAGSRPLVVTAHGTYVPQTSMRPLVGRWYRRTYRRARLIAVSRYTAAQVQRTLPDVTPTVIHNGVHFDHFQAARPRPERQQGHTILATGGVKARKGTHVLVDAFAQVRQAAPDSQLVITGDQYDSAYVARIHEQIDALDLSGHVQLLGFVDDDELVGWYQHAAVFALPSLNVGQKFEGFGLVFLEAGACGLPVIGTTGSGAEEAIIEDETGLLVPQDDSGALAQAIIRLLSEEALRSRLGVGGRQYARSQDWRSIAQRVHNVYLKV